MHANDISKLKEVLESLDNHKQGMAAIQVSMAIDYLEVAEQNFFISSSAVQEVSDKNW